jgi:hypothetical protein
MTSRPPVAGISSVCHAGILVAGVPALTVRTRRALARVDANVLTAHAADEIPHGRPWPWLFDTPSVGITKTM